MNAKKTVLVADDDAAVRSILARSLANGTTRIVAVGDGRAALDAAAARKPDAIILDVEMPGLNGFEVCSALRRDWATRSVPVVMLTGSPDAATEIGGLQAGVDRFLAKPVDTRQLKAHLDNLLERSRHYMEASPLTGLPGNRAIAEEFEERLASGRRFWLYHLDVRHFKEFNDAYGFAAGDALLMATAELLVDAIESGPDREAFAGHVGGDDFVIMTDYRLDREAVERRFASLALESLSRADAANGWFWAADRSGRRRRIPVLTLTVGAAFCRPGLGCTFEAASAAAARGKEKNKRVSAEEVVQ